MPRSMLTGIADEKRRREVERGAGARGPPLSVLAESNCVCCDEQ